MARPAGLVGNRLALAGAILYLLEWVGIIGFGAGNAPSSQGTSARDILAGYTQHATGIALLSGWLSLVLVGRVLFVAAIRDSLRRSGTRTALMDLAVGAMAVSVAIEIAAYATAAGAAQAATNGADQSTVLGLDAAANFLDLAIWPLIGISVLAAALVMRSARVFPSWLCWLGLVAAAVACAYGVVAGAAFHVGGNLFQVSQAAEGLGAIALWLWMLITGVLLFRAAGREHTPATPELQP